MFDELPRLCLDTNTVFRAVIREHSASGEILRISEARKVVLLLSRHVLSEYRRILSNRNLESLGYLFQTDVAINTLNELRYLADEINPVRAKFRYDRDPRDAMFIELAIAGNATHIISHDKDLLSLPNSRTDAGRRFRQRLPGVKVQDAATFVRENPRLFRA